MNVALIGFGIEGQAAFAYWKKQDAQITICDQDSEKEIPSGTDAQLGENYLDNLDRFDIVWRTAGINPDQILNKNPGIKDKITTTINEFLRVCPTTRVIGVTGTKGKGTTCTLISLMLTAVGEQVFLAGNIGVSPLEFLSQLNEQSWVVLELSSFQLIDLRRSPSIALCLMVVPEHLNWHVDMDDYILAKGQLFEHQSPADLAIYFANNDISRTIAGYSPALKMPYYAEPGAHIDAGSVVIANQEIIRVDELKLLGEHNWQNVCAAVTVAWQITQNVAALRSVLATFSGLEHRLEFVRELEGVKYYDDSFGTTPETAIVAIQAFTAPKIVILGGSDKGVSFDALAKVIRDNNVRHTIVIGDTAPAITSALNAQGFTAITTGQTTMSDMIRTAHSIAQPGDVVLLSTGCASFGLFKDYKDRGDQFKQVVSSLI